METTSILLEHTGRFNRLILDYINKDEKVKKFYSFSHILDNYKFQIEQRKQFPIDRELLNQVIHNQYKEIGGCKNQVLQNVALLKDENTFTVTTGHQLNIFTGPLYFIYKILHTIRLAEELKNSYPKYNFVPVYWMNAEDHDLEEVGQFNLFGKKYVWPTEQTGATGRMNPKELIAICDELDEVFKENDGAVKLISVFRKAYSKFSDLTTATRYFANELFAKYGLVIIDGDDADLKRSFKEFTRNDLVKNEPFGLVRETSIELQKIGYHVQVNPREINSFYLTEGIRNRIVKTEKGFHVMHTDVRFSEEELLQELDEHPERFSPNVVLRPLFQEHVLPNLTYVGGAGELSYWLQYKDYFAEMKISFPLLALRNHFLLIENGIGKKINNLNLLPEDLFHSVDQLVNDHILEVEQLDVDFSTEMKLLSELYMQLKTKAALIDASLVGALEAEEKRQQKTIEQWGSRFSRALKQKNEVSINRIRKIHDNLFPEGFLQERHDNIMGFYGKGEVENPLDSIYRNIRPFNTEFRSIRLR
ncbi:MAG: bacillithiol biosynthesis cysteine-adding enzyme BshC [Flavobacteriales bacterium]|nr:bacillithiol biosynthesis cysteine-adding enzyme BshC [Flavobacteriales bacterium]